MPAGPRSVARAVAVQLGGRAAGTLASLVTVAVTTRYLGVDDYGLLTVAIVFVSLWSSLAELGVSTTIVRKVGDGSAQLERLVRLNIGLSTIYSVPLAAVCAVVGAFVVNGDRAELRYVLIVVAASLALNAMSTCVTPVFSVGVRFGPVALADVVSRLASLAATLVVIALHGGLVAVAAVQLVPPAVTLVVSYIAARRDIRITPLFELRPILALARESLPITAVGIISVLYWRADGFILSLRSDAAQVAAYGLGYAIAFNLSVVSNFYLTSSLSTATALFPIDRAAFASYIRRGLALMTFAGLPVVAFGIPLAAPIIALLGSHEFVGVTRVPLILLLIAVVLTFWTGLLGQALFAANDQRFLLQLNIVNLIINVVLNLVLAGPYGAVGVGIALIVSETSGLLVTLWRLRRRCALQWPWLLSVRLLVPVAAGLAVLIPLRHLPVLIPLLSAAAVFLVVNVVIGPVTRRTLRELFARPEVTAPVTAP